MKQFIVKLEAHLALVYSLARLRADSIWTLFLHHLFISICLKTKRFIRYAIAQYLKKNEIRLLLLPHFFCFFCMRSAPRAKWVKFRFFVFYLFNWTLIIGLLQIVTVDCSACAHLHIQSIQFKPDAIVSIRSDKVNNFIGAHQFDFYETARYSREASSNSNHFVILRAHIKQCKLIAALCVCACQLLFPEQNTLDLFSICTF